MFKSNFRTNHYVYLLLSVSTFYRSTAFVCLPTFEAPVGLGIWKAPCKWRNANSYAEQESEIRDSTVLQPSLKASTHFKTNNFVTFPPTSKSYIWSKYLPTSVSWWDRRRTDEIDSGLDIKSIWASPEEGAEHMLSQLLFLSSLSPFDQKTAKQELMDIFSLFQETYLRSSNESPLLYRSRIVATRGSSGTRCPRYHTDWVPLRLVCALYGPGVVFINDSATGNTRWRKTVNKSDEIDSKKFNESIERQLKPDAIVASNCGDCVIMLGKEWEDEENGVNALVHRSPYMKGTEGRVLLTVDVA